MSGPGAADAGRRRALEDALDRVYLKLRDSERGLHAAGEPASDEALERGEALGIPPEALELWRRFDGVEIAHGESRIVALDEIEARTAEAREAGIVLEGDLVIGSTGLEDLVLPADPWEEGADVVLLSDDGQRAPFGSTPELTVLALLARSTVLMDPSGEYREEIMGDDGLLTPKTERKLCRRHLDVDEDAPYPRFRLGQLLRRSGDAAAARRELGLALRRAPGFAWARFELGRACLDLQQWRDGIRELRAAAEADSDGGWSGMVLAWAALAAGRARDDSLREALASEARGRYPGITSALARGASEAIQDEDLGRAGELVGLGLAVEPRHLELLQLRRELEASEE